MVVNSRTASRIQGRRTPKHAEDFFVTLDNEDAVPADEDVPEKASVRGAAASPGEKPELNLRLLWPVARYIEDTFGVKELQAFAAAGGLVPADFEGKNHWVSWERFEILLSKAKSQVGDDETFITACGYRMAETYGPLRFFFWATSPSRIFKIAEEAIRFQSSISQFHLVASGRNFARLRYTSSRPESRLMCLSRQAQAPGVPSLFGFPQAMLREHSCIARGDDACEYEFSWYSRPSWVYGPLIAGALVAASLIVLPRSQWLVGCLIAAGLGQLTHIVELRRSLTADRKTRDETTTALRRLVMKEAEARRELVRSHQRQREWTQTLEEHSLERTAVMAQLVERLQSLEQAREKKLLGFSHDLRNPLTIIQFSIDYLRDNVERLDVEAPAVVADLEEAMKHMRRMLSELMEVATAQKTLVQLRTQQIFVPELVERLQRRVRALVYGRPELRSSLDTKNELPEVIEMDPLVLDRVIDNLLTNAVKYTDSGTIHIELEGTPGFLLFRIEDTGRGIAASDIERIFQAGRSDPSTRASNSYGVGLAWCSRCSGASAGRST